MKRHESLVPLSRDHHDGLLLAVRLQQGRNALLRLWSHDPLWQAEFVVKFYIDHLVPHFEAEENVLFPVAKKYLGNEAVRIDRLIEEHREMSALVDFFRAPDEKTLESKLMHFGKLLEGHIRAEEREIFPLCEEKIPAQHWKQLRSRIERYRPAQSEGEEETQ